MSLQFPINDALQSSAALNAHGAHCLALNDSRGAVASFQGALSSINSFQIETNHTISSGAVLELWTSVPIASLQDDAFFVFNQTLLFEEATMGSSKNPHAASIVILFNLGLAYQWHGVMFRERSVLEKACWFYHMCVEISSSQSEGDSAAFVALLALNNRAQIHYRMLGDPETSLELLQTIRSKHAGLAGSESLESDLVYDILLNATILPKSPLSAPPAA